MFDNKSILITGGTGSFGKKLSKTILEKAVKKNSCWKIAVVALPL